MTLAAAVALPLYVFDDLMVTSKAVMLFILQTFDINSLERRHPDFPGPSGCSSSTPR